MKLSFVEIRAELKPYIQAFWVFESSIGMPASEANLAAPNGYPKLIIPCENTITSFADGRMQQSYEEVLRYIRRYNHNRQPIKWTYRNRSRRIGPKLTVTGHQ